jgi:hypothetical protein
MITFFELKVFPELVLIENDSPSFTMELTISLAIVKLEI